MPYLNNFQAQLAETVIPRGTEDWPKSNETNYFIWRTLGDDKVRDSHFNLEGKIFSNDLPPALGMPGNDYNCRCYGEPLPENINIIEKKSTQEYLRWLTIHFDMFCAQVSDIREAVDELQIT